MKNLRTGKLYTNRHISNLKINTTGEGELESITLKFKEKKHTVRPTKNDKYFQFYMDGCVKIGQSFLDEAIIDACNIMSTRSQVELIIYKDQTWHVQRTGMFTSVTHEHKRHLSFTHDCNKIDLGILAGLARHKLDNQKYKVYGVGRDNTIHYIANIEKPSDMKAQHVLETWMETFYSWRGINKHEFEDFLLVDYYDDDTRHPKATKMPKKMYSLILEDDTIHRAFIDEMDLEDVDEGKIPSISIYFANATNNIIARSVYDRHGQVMLSDDAYPKQIQLINIKDLQKN